MNTHTQHHTHTHTPRTHTHTEQNLKTTHNKLQASSIKHQSTYIIGRDKADPIAIAHTMQSNQCDINRSMLCSAFGLCYDMDNERYLTRTCVYVYVWCVMCWMWGKWRDHWNIPIVELNQASWVEFLFLVTFNWRDFCSVVCVVRGVRSYIIHHTYHTSYIIHTYIYIHTSYIHHTYIHTYIHHTSHIIHHNPHLICVEHNRSY